MKSNRYLYKDSSTRINYNGNVIWGFSLQIYYYKRLSRKMRFVFRCASLNKDFVIEVSRDLTRVHHEMTEEIEKFFDGKVLGMTVGLEFLTIYRSLIESNPWLDKRSALHPLDKNVKRWYSAYSNLFDLILSDINSKSVSTMSQRLPGVQQLAWCPCPCGVRMSVWRVVQHLNDSVKWTRNEIADWLDDLQDNQGYDFTFGSDNIGWKETGYIKESGV